MIKKQTEKQRTTKYDLSWKGVREFFKDKISQLKEASNSTDLNCGKGKLFAAILTEVLEMLIRQLGEMEFSVPIIYPDLMRCEGTPIVKVRAQTVRFFGFTCRCEKGTLEMGEDFRRSRTSQAAGS